MKEIGKILGLCWALAFFVFIVLVLAAGMVELPDFALSYVDKFQYLFTSFLTSYWFIAFFIAGWLFITYSFAKESGWRSLAVKFRYDFNLSKNEKFITGSGYIGKRYSNGTLQCYANNQGLFLKMLLPFRFGSKNLFIPWHDIASITEEYSVFFAGYPRFIKKIVSIISRQTYLNIKLKDFPEQIITVNSAGIKNEIPTNLR
ncbi:hypothetical protein [Moritella sp. JT01]|uniref:hypothetical protein n=1 Tax=Moritella sp. JT01 TaxID=756698 RepID=UPI0012FA7A0C|nr:hypothetical protein [Moritella sp. JT01]